MRLQPGARFGPYQVVEPLGAGAMGEVYRARDTRLHRDVALKVLPERHRFDAARRARFEREAQALAALNHPNIATLHGIEDADGVQALVMELVEGETLADRLLTGRTHALPLVDALPVARQIAEALATAHERGIVHRDLKPSNIVTRPDGMVKLLDFGLARAFEPHAAGADVAAATITQDVPTVVGTPAYMSPEQARGDLVDQRSDIWAFGCVLYELLSGRRAFEGDRSTDVIARVIERDPDFDALPVSTPPLIRRLVRRCLEKDPRRRLQHMGDVRHDLEDALTSPSGVRVEPSAADILRRRWWTAAAVALVALAAAGAWLIAARPVPRTGPDMIRLSIPSLPPPVGQPFGTQSLAISADGSLVAYAARDRLLIRRMGEPEALEVAAAGFGPFFSPDGAWVAFFSTSEPGLKKVPVLGGMPVPVVMTSERSAGGTWGPNGTIVFATTEGLFQVSENGGVPRLLVKPDSARKERLYAWPQFLPDGRSLLFTIVHEGSVEGSQIAWLDLQTLESRIVATSSGAARYVATGHLVYAFGSHLRVLAFDLEARRSHGDPVSLPGVEIAVSPDNGAAQFTVSETGTLLFISPRHSGIVAPDLGALRTLSWVDRRGREEPLGLDPGNYAYPRVSPDGRRVALDIPGANRDIWIWSLERKNLTKLTDGPTEDMLPLWRPDGARLFFASDRNGNHDVYSQSADGATDARAEYAAPGVQFPLTFAAAGTQLIVVENFRDVSLIHLGQWPRHEPLLHSEFNKVLPEVSPDGRWMAYESNEAGEPFEIFLRPFPKVGERRETVSIKGGRYPRWGRAGSNELFYVDPDGGMMAASVTLSPRLSLGRVTKLFDVEKPPSGLSGRPYDISPIDGRFLVVRPLKQTVGEPVDISVVLNWFDELKRLVPAD